MSRNRAQDFVRHKKHCWMENRPPSKIKPRLKHFYLLVRVQLKSDWGLKVNPQKPSFSKSHDSNAISGSISSFEPKQISGVSYKSMRKKDKETEWRSQHSGGESSSLIILSPRHVAMDDMNPANACYRQMQVHSTKQHQWPLLNYWILEPPQATMKTFTTVKPLVVDLLLLNGEVWPILTTDRLIAVLPRSRFYFPERPTLQAFARHKSNRENVRCGVLMHTN